MNTYTFQEVMQYVMENDVKFIRLAFCDIFGTQKNISIMPRELSRAFREGISIDASSIRGFANANRSDLLLFPEPSTLSVLPWRPSQGRVVRFFCDIKYPDGTPFECDARQVLRQAQSDMKKLGYSVKIGTECEFYLLKQDEEGLPTKTPHDNASYMDIAPLDKGENVRRQICLTLEEMNLRPEASHHETGPGQNEIDFAYDSAVTAADNLITFRGVVKTMASVNGLYASFLPKIYRDHPGNGLHINLSLFQNGENVFHGEGDGHSPVACTKRRATSHGATRTAPSSSAFLRRTASTTAWSCALRIRVPIRTSPSPCSSAQAWRASGASSSCAIRAI